MDGKQDRTMIEQQMDGRTDGMTGQRQNYINTGRRIDGWMDKIQDHNRSRDIKTEQWMDG